MERFTFKVGVFTGSYSLAKCLKEDWLSSNCSLKQKISETGGVNSHCSIIVSCGTLTVFMYHESLEIMKLFQQNSPSSVVK